MSSIEPLGQVRSKIVATVGPASRRPETLRALIEAGVDLFRLNFSHGTHEEHTETFRAIRAAADETGARGRRAPGSVRTQDAAGNASRR